MALLQTAPLFWMLLGMLGADPITEEVKKAATAKAEKQEKTEKKKSAKKK